MPKPIWTKRSPNSILTLQLPMFVIFFLPPPLKTRSTALLGPEHSYCLKAPREQITSRGMESDETRVAAYQRKQLALMKPLC